MKDRIALIMKEEQLTAVQFAKETGIQQASLSHILNGRNNPSLEIIKRIHQRFPHINLDWLLYGEGNMIEASKKSPNTTSLFDDENAVNAADSSENLEYAKEIEVKELQNIPKETIKETIKYVERPPKKIIEIRIFFDDGTYETLIPQK